MSCLGRRAFIGLLGGAAAWPLAARAQPARVPRIGIIDNSPRWDPFREGLRDYGYAEERTIVLEYRPADGVPHRLAAVAAELTQLPVDLMATYGTPPTQAAKQATDHIPIVMIGVGDPVGAGLVASLARPGGNVTGNTVLSPDVGAKRLQLLREGFRVSRVAVLLNPHNASHVGIHDELKVAAEPLGLALIPVSAGRFEDFEIAFGAMMRERPDAIVLTADPLHQLHVNWIIDFLARNRLLAMFQVRDNVLAGGLMSYGASLPDLFRRAAGYVHKILNGAKPADLPVEQPTKFELVINLRTAKASGVIIPEPFLLRTDEVLE